ncbi:TetR/AcrR family transcriptional regulator [Glaciibacter psychrotolerans]|uniref:AcrR family transcriptional regulator n=1 Tax=Glaciibacter psychrotolerans TaxID=670054 RepID=A0A7Z0EEB6_9MICO|nr:TetR/AcrR family transcriptional regulator [Leifsonia psychrotolerans]NYJ20082.1 AcrR family transcriptional regulator [Leifsonia psychrotolerans]
MVVVERVLNQTPREKTRLDVETIVEAGLRIAAQPGATAVTVRELGAMLGTDPTAIYRHFRNKESLMEALLDRLLAMSLERVSAPREDWRARITQLMSATLDVFVTYPAIGLEAVVLTTDGPAELSTIELMLDALAQTGLEGEELVRHYATLASYALSYSAGIAREHTLNPSITPDDSQPWIGRTLPVTAASHPRISELREELTALRDREILLLGIEMLLDGAERAGAEARSSAQPPPAP